MYTGEWSEEEKGNYVLYNGERLINVYTLGTGEGSEEEKGNYVLYIEKD